MNQQEKLAEALKSLETYKERHLVPSYFLRALVDIRTVLAPIVGDVPPKDPNAKLRDLITLVCDAAFACGDCKERDDVTYKPLFEAEQVAITNLKIYVALIRCNHAENTALCEQLAALTETAERRAGKYCDRPEDMPPTAIINIGFNVLESRLAQVEKEREDLQGQLAGEVAKRVNENVTRMEESQKTTQAELKRLVDDRPTDTCRGSYEG